MIKFLAERRFSYVNVVSVSTATTFFTAQHYWYAAVAFLIGLVLSIYLENKTKE